MGYDGICWNGCFGALTGSPEVLKSGFHGLIALGKSIVTTEMFSPAVLSFTSWIGHLVRTCSRSVLAHFTVPAELGQDHSHRRPTDGTVRSVSRQANCL